MAPAAQRSRTTKAENRGTTMPSAAGHVVVDHQQAFFSSLLVAVQGSAVGAGE
jgi:hypothetical protein